MFTIVNGVLLNPFPYPATDSIMFVSSWSRQFDGTVPLTYPDYLDFRRDNRVFAHLAAARNASFNLTDPGREPARVNGATVSANAFPMLGMTPVLGRALQEADDREGAERVAVISHGLWGQPLRPRPRRRRPPDSPLFGAAVGLVLAHWLTRGALALAPSGSLPAEAVVRLDWRVLVAGAGAPAEALPDVSFVCGRNMRRPYTAPRARR